MKFTIQDAAAALIAIIMTGGVVVLAVLEKPVPPELATGLGAAFTWVFVRGVQAAEKANGVHL